MANLYPYLQFQGNCREAMTFYQECIGGELQIMTYGNSQMAADMPAEAQNNVLHSALVKDGATVLMASDTMGEVATHGKTVSLCMVCNSKEEIETLFEKISQGGQVNHPLKEEFFGTFGDLVDKFGFTWMFQFSQNPQP